MSKFNNNISRIIEITSEEYMDKNNISNLEKINRGHCEEFANIVIQKMGGINDYLYTLNQSNFFVYNSKDVNKGSWNLYELKKYNIKFPKGLDLNSFWVGTHVWIYYKGKHYDAESPSGVESFIDLPFFTFYISKFFFNSFFDIGQKILSLERKKDKTKQESKSINRLKKKQKEILEGLKKYKL